MLQKAAHSLLDTELSKVACDKNVQTKELLTHQRLTQVYKRILCTIIMTFCYAELDVTDVFYLC